MKLFDLQQISLSNPAEWKACTEEGTIIIHYRWDILTVEIDGQEKFRKESVFRDPFRGTLSTEEMLVILAAISW